MTPDEHPMLGGLRTVSDDNLYQRLFVHRQRMPSKHPAIDYVYRLDLWEMVNKAIRAEIARRKAPPPPWWPVLSPKPAVPQRNRKATIAVAAYLGLLALVAAFAVAAGR